MSRPQGPLNTILREKYGHGRGNWGRNSRYKRDSSPFWKGVSQAVEFFRTGISYKLGKGNDISFWQDRWCSIMPLCFIYPKVYDSIENKEGMVNEYWGRSRWRISLLRNCCLEARRQKDELLILLNQANPDPNSADTPVWRWEKSGIFSVKSAYRKIIDGGCRLLNAKFLWKIKSPLKVKLFLWLITKNSILTWQNLQKRGWQGPGRCIMCREQEETTKHLFLSCPFARELWIRCGAKLKVCLNLGESDSIWDKVGGEGEKQTLQGLIVAAICWNIWRERNCRTFNNIFHSVDFCFKVMLADIRFWTGFLSEEERLRLSDDSGGDLDHLLSEEDLEDFTGEGGDQQADVNYARAADREE